MVLFLELLEKSQISRIEKPDVVDFVFHHCQPVPTETESPTVPFLRAQATSPKNIGMNHPRPSNFQPTGFFAN